MTNRASETVEAGRLAMLAHDVDALVATTRIGSNTTIGGN